MTNLMHGTMMTQRKVMVGAKSGLHSTQNITENMDDVRKWMESRLGSVPGLLAIIVTDRQITDRQSCAHVHKASQ